MTSPNSTCCPCPTEPSTKDMPFLRKYAACVFMIFGLGFGGAIIYFLEQIELGILIFLMFTCLGIVLYTKKNKIIAFLTATVPTVPINRMYISNMDWGTMWYRFIPVIGNIYDIYKMFISKSLVPPTGWSSSLLPELQTG